MAVPARRTLRPPSSSSPSTGRVTIPNLITDPTWSLQPWPISLTVGQTEVEIPALPASVWLAVLMTDDMGFDDFMADISLDIEDAVNEAVLNDQITMAELSELCFGIIATVSGRPWHIAARLIQTARASWHIIGPEMLRWINPAQVSLSAWLDVVLIVLLRNMEEKDIPLFLTRLEAPAPGVKDQEITMTDNEFMALMNS